MRKINTILRNLSRVIWVISKPISRKLIHKSKYLVRLDDSCETQDHYKWLRIELLLDKLEIKPMVAVIPKNKDKELFFSPKDKEYWETIKRWQKKNWTIGLHGYEHTLKKVKRKWMLFQFFEKTEFAEQDLKIQSKKIKNAYKIMKKNNINPTVWISPNHSYDRTTINVIKKVTPIRIINDGISLYPFKNKNMIFIPQQLWRAQKRYFGIWTICLHPNNLSEEELSKIEKDFSSEYFKNKFIDIDYALKRIRTQNIFSYIYKLFYYLKDIIKNYILKI